MSNQKESLQDALRAKAKTITVHRDHTGRWWIEDEITEKLAPDLFSDSSTTFKVYLLSDAEAEIQDLKNQIENIKKNDQIVIDRAYHEKRIYKEQVEAAKTLLQEFSAYYKNMEGGCYPDWLIRLEKVLESAQNSGKL